MSDLRDVVVSLWLIDVRFRRQPSQWLLASYLDWVDELEDLHPPYESIRYYHRRAHGMTMRYVVDVLNGGM